MRNGTFCMKKDSDLASEYKREIDSFLKIFYNYSYDEIALYSFVFLSHPNNKNFLELRDILNLSLSMCNATKKSGCPNYNSFIVFSESIIRISSSSNLLTSSDNMINDLGQIKVKYNGSVYPILVSTGYYNSFQIINMIQFMNKNDDFEELLRYQASFIDLYNGITSVENKFFIVDEIFYNRAVDIYNEINVPKYITNNLSNLKNDIFRSHCICKNDKYYILFNSGLLIDYYVDLMEYNRDNEYINKALYDFLFYNFYYYSRPNDALFAPIIKCDENNYYADVFIHCENKAYIILFKNDKNAIDNLVSLTKKDIEVAEGKDFDGKIRILKSNQFDEIRVLSLAEMTHPYYINSLTSQKNYDLIFPSDLLFMLCFSESLTDILKFFYEFDKYSGVLSSSVSDVFVYWMENIKSIIMGTANLGMINFDSMTDEYIYDYFNEYFAEFPFNSNSDIFKNCFSWVHHLDKNSSMKKYDYFNRDLFYYSRFYKINDVCTACFSIPYTENIINSDEQMRADISYLSALFDCFFGDYSHLFESFVDTKLLIFSFLPIDHDTFTKVPHGKYVAINGNTERYSKEEYHIQFGIDMDIYHKDYIADDRQHELVLFGELLLPLKKRNYLIYKNIKNQLVSDYGERPYIKQFEMKFDYKVSWKNDYQVSNEHFKIALNDMSKKMCELGIITGKKYAYNDWQNVENIFISAYHCIENIIEKYQLEPLVILLLNELGMRIPYKEIHEAKRRYSDVDSLDFKKNNEEYEQIKKEITELELLVEASLALNKHGDIIPNKDDCHLLMAYARWICIYKECSQCLEFNDENIELLFNFDYIPEVSSSTNVEKYNELISMRNAMYKGYQLKHDSIDSDYVVKMNDAFKIDQGISWIEYIDFLKFLTFPSDCYKVADNTFRMSYSDLVSYINDNIISPISADEMKIIIDYSSLDCSNLKKIGEEEYEYVPFHNRERRCNSIHNKPLIKINNFYYFSPAYMHYVEHNFRNQLMDFVLPFDVGMCETNKVLKQWKKRYEDLMEVDLKNELSKYCPDFLDTSVYLNKLDPKGCHPRDLGDYDVLGINVSKKIIIIHECKVLEKVGSYYEFNRQQKSFYFDHKDDERFQKRIDYLNNNKKKILKNLRIPNGENFKVLPFMVVNKNFSSLYKKVAFDIFMFDEMINMYEDIFKKE